MARSPRVIVGGRLYEIVSRAREGLPLPPTRTINTLLRGILARTQRDEKVTLCNFVFMSNHSHVHVIPKNPGMLPRFYCELQKKITDTVRALLGKSSLRIWEDRTGVIQIENLEDVINRIVYVFCNPSKAGLVDSIDEYPGFSSWKAFRECKADVDAEVVLKSPWHPVAGIPELPPSRVLSRAEDNKVAGQLCSSELAVAHTLVIKPLAWLKLYDVTDPAEVERIREIIISRVRQQEASYRAERAKAHKSTMGPVRLSQEPCMKPHVPREKTRKIFLICANRAKRIELLDFYSNIFAICRSSYEAVKQGIERVWPPGTFIPWLPPQVCSP